MKKIFIAVGVAMMFGLASCGGVDGKIEDLKEVNIEISKVKDDKNMDAKERNAKLFELYAKQAKIEAELAKKDLTIKQEKAKDEARKAK